MLQLKQMNQQQYQPFLERAVVDYAEDKIKAGAWRETEALQKSKSAFAELLPRGILTPNEHLFMIYFEETIIGHTWLHVEDSSPKSAFIYDILIFEAFQGKGYGKKAMLALDQQAKAIGCAKISLHVFAHNKRAVNLYQKMGYQFTDYSMSKIL